jgi:hypothetical protein
MRVVALFVVGLLWVASGSIARAAEKECVMDQQQDEVVATLFSRKAHLYSVLWWSDPQSKIINARSFIINGHDSVPVFSSEAEGKAQLAGSNYEKELVGIDPGLLAAILQGKEYAILNPRGQQPIQFKTCILKQFVKVPDA